MTNELTPLQQALSRVAEAECGCTLGTAGYNMVATEQLDTRMRDVLALLPQNVRESFDTSAERNFDHRLINGQDILTVGENRVLVIAAAVELKRAGLLDTDPTNDRPELITSESMLRVAREQLAKVDSANHR